MDLLVNVPTPSGTQAVRVEAGRSTVFLGANGGGKTRLGVYLEESLPLTKVHRLGAQRALQFSASVPLVDFDTAEAMLFYGIDPRANTHLTKESIPQYKIGSRWGSKPATHLISDYVALLQALFADETREAVKYRQAIKEGRTVDVPTTRFDQLQTIWHSLLPHRKLVVLDATIKVTPYGSDGVQYDATELSDGERVILYLIGQCLLMPGDGILIVDEPELHIHRALMTKLWDALEAARSDCAFIYITHDLEFAASRSGARKFALRNYFGTPQPSWDIEPLPSDDAMPEEVVCRIVGSRQPVVFIEGDSGSLDAALYRRVYPSYTIISVGGCEVVINSVASFKRNAALHRFDCFGIVDADDRSPEEITRLRAAGIFVSPVCEVENTFLLPRVFSALTQTLGYDESSASEIVRELSDKIIATAATDEEGFALRYTKRRIDRALKTVGLTASDVTSLASEFSASTSAVDPTSIYADAQSTLRGLIAERDVEGILAIYDNKGMLAEAAKLLKMSRKGLEEHIGRMLRAPQGNAFLDAIRESLPALASSTPEV